MQDEELFRARTRRATLVILAGALLLALLWFGLPERQPPASRQPVISDLSMPPHEILPGAQLYYLGSDTSYGYTAAYALRTSDGIIVIDPGLRFSALQAAFRVLKLELSDVKIVLVTHRHADHWFAAQELQKRTGAKIKAHQDELRWLTQPDDLRQYYTIYATPITQVPIVDEVQPLAGGEIIQLGDVAVEAIDAPGHTTGSLVFHAVIGGYHVLWSGDTVMTLDMEGTRGDHMLRLGPRYGGDAAKYLATLKRLQQIPVELLLPGHPLLGSSYNPAIGPDTWNHLLSGPIAKWEAWLRDYEAEMGIFLDGVPRALTSHVYYLGEHDSTASYLLKSDAGLILVDPGRRSQSELQTSLAEWNLDLGDLRAVLLTSVHPSHAFIARELCDATGAELYYASLSENSEITDNLGPGRQLQPLEEVVQGELRIRALAGTPGGGGDMCYLVQSPRGLILLGGDSVGRFSKAPRSYHRDADERALRRSARDRESLTIPRDQPVDMVLPAHPEFDESPFYLPGEWAERVGAVK